VEETNRKGIPRKHHGIPADWLIVRNIEVSSSGVGPIILPNIGIVRSNDPFDSKRIQ
jgi:hypothetical protein